VPFLQIALLILGMQAMAGMGVDVICYEIESRFAPPKWPRPSSIQCRGGGLLLRNCANDEYLITNSGVFIFMSQEGGSKVTALTPAFKKTRLGMPFGAWLKAGALFSALCAVLVAQDTLSIVW
jgi:hypothetical protein